MKYVFLIVLYAFSGVLVAQTKIDSLEALLSEKQGLEKVELLNNLSFSYWNVSPDKGLDYAQMAHSIALKEGSKSNVAKSLQNKGINYWAKSELHLALENCQASLKIYEDLRDSMGIGSLLGNMGIIYKDLSNYEFALSHYLRALKIAENNGFADLKTKTLNNVSLIYLSQKNYGKALEYTQEAINLSKKQNNVANLAAQQNTLGRIYEAQDNYEKAQVCYKEALQTNENNKNNYGTTISLYNIGNTEYHLKNYSSALEYFKKSLILSSRIDDQIGILYANKSIGLVNKELKQYTTALIYYKKAYNLAVHLNLKEDKLDIYKNYSELYKAVGKFNKSLDYLEQFIVLKDSIYSHNSAKQIAEMQTKYDSEKKEKENELLRKNSEIQNLAIAKQTHLRNSFIILSILVIMFLAILYSRYKIKKDANDILSQKNNLIELQKEQLVLNNDELTKQYDQLELLNATKDKFFKIISHDLKAPFNSILGFSELLKSDYNAFENHERIDMINEIDKSSKFAYDLLINLLTWARTQTGDIKISKEPIVLKELVDTCANLYGQSAVAKKIDIVVDIPNNISLTIDKNTSLIFIGNLINNAIKFTPEGGLITINTSEQKDFIKLHIIDTGVGIPPDVIKSLFKIEEEISTQGTNDERGTGLGLILCKEFVEKNGGEISVASEVGKGSEFTITMPNN